MTIRIFPNNILPALNDLEAFLSHASGMHLLIQVALKWTAETPSEDGRRALLNLLMHGVARFGKGSPTENDEAMLPVYRMLVRHSRSLVSRGLLYSRLYDEKCYRSSATFYRDWIEALMSEGMRDEVDGVVDLAMKHEAVPSKLLQKTLGRLSPDSFELRERVLNVLGDVNHNIGDVNRNLFTIVRGPRAPEDDSKFSVEELQFVLSSSKMSEVLLYLGAALAPPEALHLISERIGLIRYLAYEVDAEEAK